MAVDFDKHYKKYDTWYDRYKFVFLSELEAVKNVLPKDGKRLEIGVGTGRFAAPLGIEFGIDPSMQMPKLAKARGIKVKLGIGEDLPFSNSSFDYVVIIITLCFVKDHLKVLKEAKRVLKKNGKIIVAIIDKKGSLGKFYQKKKSIFYQQAHFFSVEELTDLIRGAGFKRIAYSQTLFSLPDKIMSIEKPKKGFGSGNFVVLSGKSA